MKHRSLLHIAVITALAFSVQVADAAKGPCTTVAAAAVGGAAVAAYNEDQAISTQVRNNYVQSPLSTSSTAGPFACVSSIWPGLSSGFSIPTMDSIINGVLTAQIQKACQAARTELSQATSGLTSSTSINTGIAGMPAIGGNASVGTSGAGSPLSSFVSSANSVTSSAVSTVSAPTNALTNEAKSEVGSGWSTIKSLF